MKEGEPALYCTGRGYLPWKDDNGKILLVQCYYLQDVAETIISPNDIVLQNIHLYNKWKFSTNYDKGSGWFQLIAQDGISHYQFTAYNENNLWFHYNCGLTVAEREQLGPKMKAVVRTLSEGASYELRHH
jgi:hypothetical protein